MTGSGDSEIIGRFCDGLLRHNVRWSGANTVPGSDRLNTERIPSAWVQVGEDVRRIHRCTFLGQPAFLSDEYPVSKSA